MDLKSAARRNFLASAQRTAPLAALALGGAAVASAKAPARWEPVRHEKDNWFDETSAKHRLVIDSTDTKGFGSGVAYASNYMLANRTDYGLQNSDLAVVVIARHISTPFAYNNAIWEKYGEAITMLTEFQDPKTKQAPKVNLFTSDQYGPSLPNLGTTLDSVIQQGVRFAVCGLATRFIAGAIAKSVGGDADKVYNEVVANLIPNSRIVPAGIVAVSRAQERGYTLASA